MSSKPLVLIADDEPRIVKLVSMALQEEGFRVVTAANGEEALRKAEEYRPDVVLLDIVMPDIDGIEVMQQLRERRPVAVILDIRIRGEDTWGFLTELKRREETQDIPVLVVTTVADPHKGLGLGADAYAVKPVERVWLLDTLAPALGDDDAPRRRRGVRQSG